MRLTILFVAWSALAHADPAQIRPEVTAGVYWVPYETCDDCAKPVALAAYVTADPTIAREIVRALDGKLGFGLPYAVHTDDLGVTEHGIAVVIGAFSSSAAATGAARTAPVVRGLRAHVLAVPTDNAASLVASPRHVTVVDRGGPVRAWSAKDVDVVHAALDQRDWDTEQERSDALAAAFAKLRPACTVAPGDLFVVEDSEIRWYELAPVRCGGALAYIPWTASLLGHAVILPSKTGHVLYQVVGAECDSPIILAWRYDEHGRHSDADPAQSPSSPSSGGGGGSSLPPVITPRSPPPSTSPASPSDP